MQIIKKPQELFEVGTDIEQHNVAVMVENMTDEFKKKAILKRGELYSNFDGTQRECAEHFGVGLGSINDYMTIYDNHNLVFTTDEHEISKNNLLKLVREKKEEETGEVEDFELTVEDAFGNMNKKNDKTLKEIEELVINVNENESPEVKNALTQKGFGLKRAQTVLALDVDSEKKVELIKMKKAEFDEFINGEPTVEKVTNEEKKKLNTKAKTEIEKLREENKKLKEENKELHKAMKTQESIEKLNFFIVRVIYAEMDLRKIKSENARLFNSLSVPLRSALEVLQIPEENFEGLDTIKKMYRDKAKKAHPDAGGTKEQFAELSKAYELLKTHYKG